jgi:hypothetical protein
MRSMLCEAEFTAEVIPVDQAICGLIGIGMFHEFIPFLNTFDDVLTVGYTVASMKQK